MLTDITHQGITWICLNLRETDKREVFAIRPHDSAVYLAHEVHSLVINRGRGRIAWHNGRPAALAAFTENWAGNWEVWMFGTDDFKSVVVELVRWFRKEANDILTVCEGRRLQCDAQADNAEAIKLIEAMGGRAEGPPMVAYGKDGSSFQRFVWLNGDNDAVLKPHFTRAA